MTRNSAALYSHASMRAFELFFLPWRRRHLRTAPPLGLPPADACERPLILIGNHTSWWDGFLMRDLHRALRPDAPFHIVMESSELARLPFFRRLGAVGIDAQCPGSVLRTFRTLQRAAHASPRAVIVYFPQGRIRPSWQRPLRFERGVELLLKCIGACDVAPVGLHIEPLNRASPTAFTSVGPLLHADESGASTVTTAVLERAVTVELDRIAALLAQHVPA